MDKENMLPVGTTLRDGTYKIEKQLSSGGFGNTYVVRNLIFDEIFAMKEFFMKGINLREEENVTVSVPDNKASFESQKGKFLKEAQRLRKLDNKHIVRVHDLFESNGTVYYIMDFIEGQTVAEYIKDTGKPIAEQQALNIFSQVLEVLDFVHHQTPPMLHLDIKPDNIMLDKQGNVFLLDFGSSKQIDSEDGVTTSSGFTMTKGYAPSELIDGNKDRIGPWTDFYELGATLYNMVTGKKPPTASEVSEDGRKAFSFSNTISIKIQDLIVWLMSHNRSQRPHDAKEVLQRVNKPNVNSQSNSDDDATEYQSQHVRNYDDDTSVVNEEKSDFVRELDEVESQSFMSKLLWRNKHCTLLTTFLHIVSLVISFIAFCFVFFYLGVSMGDSHVMLRIVGSISVTFPFCSLLALLFEKKWGFYGLLCSVLVFVICILSVGIAVTELVVCLVMIIYVALFYYSLKLKKEDVAVWDCLDQNITDKLSSILILSYTVIVVCTISYGYLYTRNMEQENANRWHADYESYVASCQDHISKSSGAITKDEKIENLIEANHYLKKLVELENSYRKIQPEFYNKSEELNYSIENFLSDVSDEIQNIDINNITDYPTVIGKFELAIKMNPSDSLFNLYNKVLEETGYIRIRNVEFCNKNDSIIDDYGAELFSHRMRYLGARINYDGIRPVADMDYSHDMEFKIKVFTPSGVLKQGESSPKGYSFVDSCNVTLLEDNFIVLLGWGNAEESTYERGIYRYEIWYKEKKIYSTKVQIK